MKIQFSKLALFSLVAVTLVAVPATSRAEDKTNAPAAPATGSHRMRSAFHGKVSAVDAAAMTLTVDDNTLNITSETLISKDSKPAVLSEIVVGDFANGAYKTDVSGKLNATSIRIQKESKKERKKAVDAAPSAAAVPATPPRN